MFIILPNAAGTYYPTDGSGGCSVVNTPASSRYFPGVTGSQTQALHWSAATNPSDGQQCSINDGIRTVVFEFDSNASVTSPSATYRQVVIGANLAATLVTLAAQINTLAAAGLLRCTAVAAATDIALTATAVGAFANSFAFTNGATNGSVTAISNGADPATGTTPGRLIRVLSVLTTPAAPGAGTLTVAAHDGTGGFTFSEWSASNPLTLFGRNGYTIGAAGLSLTTSAANMPMIVEFEEIPR